MKMRANSGEIIKLAVDLGLDSATALATAAGVSRSTATKAMRGEVMALGAAAKIAEALKVDLSTGRAFESVGEVEK